MAPNSTEQMTFILMGLNRTVEFGKTNPNLHKETQVPQQGVQFDALNLLHVLRVHYC
jgi:hypothetical protein